MNCNGCDKPRPIVNKKYGLCGDCVFEKNHGGKSRAEVYAARSAAKPQKVYQIKTKSKPKQQTAKEKVVKDALSELKNQIRIDAAQDNMYYCWGCGHTDKLDCSHILSVGRYKHLELDRANINLFCRDCHRTWESGVLEKIGELHTFKTDLDYIKQHDFQRFIGILHDINKYLYWNKTFDSQLIRKFSEILEKNREFVA